MSLRWDPVAEVGRMVRALGVPPPVTDAIEAIIRNNLRPDALRSQAIMPATAPNVGQVARHFHRKSLERAKILNDLLNDPSWHMLLALVADEERKIPVNISELCFNSGAPPTTALRHLQRMHQMGLVERHGDPRDQRRVFVALSDKTREDMNSFIRDCCIALPEAANRSETEGS